MIKKFLLLSLAILILFIAAIYIIKPKQSRPAANTTNGVLPPATPTSQITNSADFIFSEKKYRISWFTVDDAAGIKLIPNFQEKKNARDFISQKCKKLVNGSFYSQNYQPLGLFITNGNKIHEDIRSTLMNGYINIIDGKLTISKIPQIKDADIILQSGPLLWQNGQPKNLNIKNDELARRILLATNPSNQIIFMVVYTQDSVFEGPMLNDLPMVISAVEGLTGFTFFNAINLDGGTASAFYSGYEFLEEFMPVGSFFCIN